jgi:hypothetical protein
MERAIDRYCELLKHHGLRLIGETDPLKKTYTPEEIQELESFNHAPEKDAKGWAFFAVMFAIIAHAFTDIDGKGAGTPRTAREHASSIFDKSAVDSVIPDIRTLNIQSTATASSRAPSFHFGPTSCATSWPTS